MKSLVELFGRERVGSWVGFFFQLVAGLAFEVLRKFELIHDDAPGAFWVLLFLCNILKFFTRTFTPSIPESYNTKVHVISKNDEEGKPRIDAVKIFELNYTGKYKHTIRDDINTSIAIKNAAKITREVLKAKPENLIHQENDGIILDGERIEDNLEIKN